MASYEPPPGSLHAAAARGDVQELAALLDGGADANAADPSYDPEVEEFAPSLPLGWAARNGHAAAARMLIERGARVSDVDDVCVTPLHWAAQGGDAELAELLLDAGADVNAAGLHDYDTPLYKAISYANDIDSAIVELLLSRGADVNLLPADVGARALHHAARAGNTPAVEAAAAMLLRSGAAGCAQGPSVNTALMLAAGGGHLETMRVLLGLHAAVDAKNASGGTPLMAACDNGHVDAAALLLSRGADVNATDDVGSTCAHCAVDTEEETAEALVRVLLRAGARADMQDGDGHTPLDRAAECGRMTLLRMMLDARGIAGQPQGGAQAVAAAAAEGYIDAAMLLVRAGAALPDVARNSSLAAALAAEVRAVPEARRGLQQLIVGAAGEMACLARARGGAARGAAGTAARQGGA